MKTRSINSRRNQACAFESLEDRQHFSVYSVTSTADSGTGSLRQAILNVNADKGAATDTIKFAIGKGAQTIKLNSALPNITHSVAIDGTTQPGYAGSPLISIKAQSSSIGLLLSADNSSVKSLNILDSFTGIDLHASGDIVFQNNVESPVGDGIVLSNSSDDYVTYNTVTGAGGDGLVVSGTSTNDQFNDNNITNGKGTAVLLEAEATDNVVVNNQLNDNGVSGILLVSNSNTIENNYVGTNGGTGIDVFGSHNTISQNSLDGNHLGLQFEGSLAGGINSAIQNTIEYNKTGGVVFNDASNDTLSKNTVALNDGPGITVMQGNFDTLSQNQVFSNSLVGISLIENANHNQPAPELDKSTYAGSATDIGGKLLATPDSTYNVELFANPEGGTQGNVYLGSVAVKINSLGYALFTAKLPVLTSAGETITATATSPAGDTSGFSNAVINQPYTNPLLNPIKLAKL